MAMHLNNQVVKTKEYENKHLVISIETLCDKIKEKVAIVNDGVDDDLKVRRANELLWRINGELSILERDLVYQYG